MWSFKYCPIDYRTFQGSTFIRHQGFKYEPVQFLDILDKSCTKPMLLVPLLNQLNDWANVNMNNIKLRYLL